MTYPGPNAYPPPAGHPATPSGEQGISRLSAGGFYSLDPSVSTPPTALMPAPLLSAPPNSGQPMSGQPMSGSPTSGFPGQPIGYPVAEPPKQRGVALPLLVAFLVLAVIAAGIFVGLWADKSNKFDASETRSNQHQAALDQTKLDLEQTRTGLKTKADELTKAQEELRGAEAGKTELKRQRDVLGVCLKLLIEAIDALAVGDETTAQKKISEMKVPCNEAEVIVGI